MNLNWGCWHFLSAENLAFIKQPHPASSHILPCQHVFPGMRRGVLIMKHTPAQPACLQYPHHCLGPTGFPSSLLTFVRFCLISGGALWKIPLWGSFKSHVSFITKLFFSSYVFHKYSLSLITAWPWGDLKSQNLIIRMDPRQVSSWTQYRKLLSNMQTSLKQALVCVSAVTGQ